MTYIYNRENYLFHAGMQYKCTKSPYVKKRLWIITWALYKLKEYFISNTRLKSILVYILMNKIVIFHFNFMIIRDDVIRQQERLTEVKLQRNINLF